MNDVTYIIFFVFFFGLLGLIMPLVNDSFNSDYNENDLSVIADSEGASTGITMIVNLIAMPFWTFGLIWWVNLWVLLPIRIAFIFLVARNIWVGGGS